MKRGFLFSLSTLIAAVVAFCHITPCANAQTAAPAAEAATGTEGGSGEGGGNEVPQDGPMSSGVDVADIDNIAQRLGLPKPNLPKEQKREAPKQEGKKQESTEETEEEKADSEAEELARKNETPEQKAERERLENETPEEKAAREAAEAKGNGGEGETIELELTEQHEAYINQEIEARTADFTKRATEAEAKVADLESKVQTLGTKQGGVPLGIHPLLLSDSEADVAEHQRQLSEFKAFCTENFDGYESADGKTVFTKEQIRKRLSEVEQELEQVVPAARQSLQMRAVWEPVVKKAYPTLYDTKHADYRVAQGILRACPNLRLFPNHMILIGDALAGEKLRLAQNPPAKTGGAGAVSAKVTVATKNGRKIIIAKKPAPRTPGGSRPGNASPSDRRTAAQRGNVDVAGFSKAGGTRNALTATVAKFLGA